MTENISLFERIQVMDWNVWTIRNNVELEDEINQLFIACLKNDESTIKKLIENGVNVNCKYNMYGTPITPILIAIDNHNYNVIEMLLNNGVDINIVHNNKYNLLMYACKSNSNIDMIKFLINYKININYQNEKNGKTALMIACNNYRYDIVRVLLENGANPNIQDNVGDVALSKLLFKNKFSKDDIDIINLLIEYGTNINIQDTNGSTVLMQLIENYAGCDGVDECVYEIFKYLLLSCDYNFNITDNDGNNLLTCANSDTNFIKLILDYLE